eukprot:c4816_g1_i1 orf=380-2872(-)
MPVFFAEQLEVLDISNNQLYGLLPSFEYLYALRTLRLRNNLFTGSIPPVLLTTMQALEELDLSMNKFSGEISVVTSATLQILNLSSNMLDGMIPKKIGSCKVMDLSSNRFSGDLSMINGWGDSLQYLDLSSNDLIGELPDQTAQFVRLIHLNLSHNALSGLIPGNFGSFPKLSTIDLSFNLLSGSLPPFLFNTSSLLYLSLSNNHLVGSIPLQGSLPSDSAFISSPSFITQLQELELSNNKLSGTIPDEIGKIQTLQVLDLSNNQISGIIPNALDSLSRLHDLDLSGNQLNGSIPDALPQSLEKLNVSNNNLSGVIPSNLNRFPLSSFFPGNGGLHSVMGGISLPPNGPLTGIRNSHHKGIGTAVKACVIAGCIAGMAFVIAIGLLYYKGFSKSHECGKGSEFGTMNKDTEKDHKLLSPAAYFEVHNNGDPIPSGMAFSADVLLASGKSSAPAKFRGEVAEGVLWSQDVRTESGDSSKLIGLEMSPSRISKSSSGTNNQYDLSLQTDETLPVEPSLILNVQSPDRLAGDLCFLVNDMVFTAEELSRAPAEVLGRSSHGTSYKATLDNGHALTVKWLREGLAKSKKEFAKEAKKFGKIRHPNVIPLRAYYWGPRDHEKLILSDFVSLGSLSAHLSERMGRRFSPLLWQQRLMIAVDIARGLVYLHCERHLPHGNLKATNVLLDGPNFNGRLADYSLHLLMTPEGTANQILNAGALGYRAPELASMSKPRPSYKGDVYAFGVIMLEILTGKGAGDIISGHCGAVDLTDWVRLLATEGRTIDCFDPVLVGAERDREPPRGMDGMLALALRCISPQSERQDIQTVYEELTALSA